jgi:copper chaperone CopZ
MKTIMLVLAMFSFGIAFNQKNTETIEIKTSAVCGMCKDKIEETLNYTKGVKFSELDVETKIVTIKFRTDKTSKKELIAVINGIGYDAEKSPANKEAYANLPGCCKKGSKCND